MEYLLLLVLFIVMCAPCVVWVKLQMQIDELKKQLKGQQNEH